MKERTNLTPGQVAYQAYLQSDHWKELKARKAAQTRPRCFICASPRPLDLHHLFYRGRWEDAQTSDLRWMCRRCHSTAHDLIDCGVLTFPKPDNHNSCFILTKMAVKKALGIEKVNMFNLK